MTFKSYLFCIFSGDFQTSAMKLPLQQPKVNTLHNVCAVHWGVQYNGRCSVHQGDIMSTVEGYHEYTGGYHDKCEGRSLEKQLNF